MSKTINSQNYNSKYNKQDINNRNLNESKISYNKPLTTKHI
jgi:hypothetical protein